LFWLKDLKLGIFDDGKAGEGEDCCSRPGDDEANLNCLLINLPLPARDSCALGESSRM
jgi:hypothetical protein